MPDISSWKIRSTTRLQEEKPNQFLVEGDLGQAPKSGYHVWLITASLSGDSYWPQGELKPDGGGKEWQRTIGLGPTTRHGERMRVLLVAVSEAGHLLCDFHTKTVDKTRVSELCRLPLSALPPGTIECDHRDLDPILPPFAICRS